MDLILFYINFVCAALSFVFVFYTIKTKTPLMFPTQQAATEGIIGIIQAELAALKKDNPVIVDLGSGAGGLCFALAKKFPEAKIIGIELAWPAWVISKIRQTFSNRRNLKFIKQSFWKYDINNADIILTYLASHLMAQIDSKLSAEAKEGTLVISNTFPLPKNREPIQRIPIEASVSKELWVYRI